MSLERAFLHEIREHPEDPAPRLIFADWLEEHEDPRGVFLRDLTPFEERYELRERLWTFGMSQGYRAMDRRTQRLVTMDMGLGCTWSHPDQLWKEATISVRCRHPHLLPLLDFGFDNAGCIFLVRPAIEGEHLSTRLPRWNEGLSSETFWATLPRLVHALSAACAAVACAHEHGFIHRSLGPPAIFLGSRKEEVFVVAWDCAASADCPAEEGLLVGRPAYIAPEQVQSPETVTPSADVWGLGGILYVLLFGRPPNVPSGTQESTLEIIRCAVEPKTRGVLRPGLLPDRAVQLSSSGFFARLFGAARLGTPLPIQALEDICLRALEIEPSRRQPSMAALAAELDGWLARYGDPLPE